MKQNITRNSLLMIKSTIAKIFLIFLGLTACSYHATDNTQVGKSIDMDSLTVSKETSVTATDSLMLSKDELTKIYTQAIAEFIKACYIKDKTTFDTLYFGKHMYGQQDDFPDIELPLTIGETEVRLVTPEVGQKIQMERKSFFYVNMMGWIDKKQAEFLLVVFSNEMKHQYDYYINFNYDNSRKKFELNNIAFESYLDPNKKVSRIIVYKDGKYFEEK